jgi:hypothetical protein
LNPFKWLKIDTLEPYHEFAGVLFQTAADPHSPLNPFAHAAAPVRRDSIKLFEALVAESKARIPNDLRAELPYLLWLYHMGIILFWIHDSSRKSARTYGLIDQTVDLLDKLISLASPNGSPLIVLTASSTEASEWRHSIWQQMMSAAVPYKLSNTILNKVSFANESWPDGRAKYVPNGLRMVETLLLREYPEEDVVTCYVSNLDKLSGLRRRCWPFMPTIRSASLTRPMFTPRFSAKT